MSLFISFSITNSVAQGNIISLSRDSSSYALGHRVEILGYKGNGLNIENILLPQNQKKFELSQQASPNHGFSILNYWFKIKIEGKAEEVRGKEWLFQMKNPNIDTLSVYFLNEKNEIVHQYHTGDRLPFAKRPILYYKFNFPIPFEKSEKLTVYVHACGFYSKMHDLMLIEETALFDDSQYGLAFAIFLNTILTALILYNLLLYISLRDISYFYYIAYLTFVAMHLIATTGLGYQFLYPTFPTFANYISNASATVGGSFMLLFSYHFLKVRTLFPVWVHWILYSLVGLGFFIFAWIIIAIWSPWYIPYIMTTFAVQLLSSLMLIITLGIWGLYKGSRAAKFFLAAWVAMFVPTSLSIVRVWGIELSVLFSDYGVQIGTALEALLLSFGLADKIKVMEIEKRKAQQDTIHALRENENMIREQNNTLEQKVKERTLALAEANDEMIAFNEELNQTNEELSTTLEIVNYQKNDIEQKNQAILDSINYAKRIQEAILPTKDDFNRLLPDSFVFFKPRDIVSGDFYFLAEKNEQIILSAIDCTGHGVPGAFMSLIAKELLDQIILEHGITESDIILNELHKGIRKALKQEESDNRDGMDLSLLVIDKQNRQVQFAGAKNALIYIQDGKIEKIKGDSFTIGGEQREQKRVFNKHNIPILDTPTYFYLFTDGFQDQFGSELDKKFSFAQLKQTFFAVHTQDMLAQKEHLTTTFLHWVGKRKQTDDVLIVGIKI